MSIEAMKQALGALEEYQAKGPPFMSCDAAVAALRAAIEQSEKPVAWYDPKVMDEDRGISWTPGQFHTEPLYTAPPPRKLWVGLTGDEVNEFAAGCHLGNSVQGAIRKAEAKLKEKNT